MTRIFARLEIAIDEEEWKKLDDKQLDKLLSQLISSIQSTLKMFPELQLLEGVGF